MTYTQLKFSKIKDCFLHCSSSTLKSFSSGSHNQPVVVVAYQNADIRKICLAVHTDDTLSSASVYLNKYFASMLSFTEGQIFIEDKKDVAVINSLSLTCSPEDYSIVQLQYELIEQELLNQIKVVSEGMKIIIWLSASLSIKFSIHHLEPSTSSLLNTYSKLKVMEEVLKDNLTSMNGLNSHQDGIICKLSCISDITGNLKLPEVSLKCFCASSKSKRKYSLLSKLHSSEVDKSKVISYLTYCPGCILESPKSLILLSDKSLFPYFLNNEAILVEIIDHENMEHSVINFKFQDTECKLSMPYLGEKNSKYSAYIWYSEKPVKFDLKCKSNEAEIVRRKDMLSLQAINQNTHLCQHSLYESIVESILQSLLFPRKSFSLLTSPVECYGAGKTFIMTKLLNDSRFSAHFIKYADATSMRGKRFDNVLKEVSNMLNICSFNQPSILLLDNLDAVLPSKSKNEDPSGDEIFGTRLAHRLKEIFHEFQNFNVEIVVSSQCVTSFHPTLLEGLDNLFEIPLLTTAEQTLFLKTIVPSHDEKTIKDMVKDLSLRSTLTAGEVSKLGLAISRISQKNCGSLSSELNQMTEVFNLRKDDRRKNGLQVVDCGGLADVKLELNKMLVLPSKCPDLISQIPFQLNRGLLLYGPPGVGKTHIVNSISSSIDMSFLCVKGPELLNKYIGASEEAVRSLFRKAEDLRPTLIFFDEFDSLAPRRGNDTTGVMDRVVNQLLTELDGVSKKEGIFIIAATSRPDAIDPALLRPGRIGRYKECPMPNLEERAEIWRCQLENVTHNPNVKYNVLASKTNGYSGADIKAIIYNAQLSLIKSIVNSKKDWTKPVLKQQHILDAISSTKPSLSFSDVRDYDQIFRDFLSGSVSVATRTTQK